MRTVTEGLCLAVIAALAIWGALQVPAASPGDTWAGIVPMGAALALLVIGLWITVGGLRQRTADGEAIASQPGGALHVVGLFIVAVLYQQSLRWFGYILPTAIAAPVVLSMFGVRSHVGLALSVVLCPLAFYLIFFVALGVFPPYGEVFDLMQAISG